MTKALELHLNAKYKYPPAVLCFSIDIDMIDIDASHAVNPKRRSQGAACISLGVGHIHASTAIHKQNTKSSLESEYIATADNDNVTVTDYF